MSSGGAFSSTKTHKQKSTKTSLLQPPTDTPYISWCHCNKIETNKIRNQKRKFCGSKEPVDCRRVAKTFLVVVVVFCGRKEKKWSCYPYRLKKIKYLRNDDLWNWVMLCAHDNDDLSSLHLFEEMFCALLRLFVSSFVSTWFFGGLVWFGLGGYRFP